MTDVGFITAAGAAAPRRSKTHLLKVKYVEISAPHVVNARNAGVV